MMMNAPASDKDGIVVGPVASESTEYKRPKKILKKKIATLQAQLLEFPVKKSVAYEEYNQMSLLQKNFQNIVLFFVFIYLLQNHWKLLQDYLFILHDYLFTDY